MNAQSSYLIQILIAQIPDSLNSGKKGELFTILNHKLSEIVRGIWIIYTQLGVSTNQTCVYLSCMFPQWLQASHLSWCTESQSSNLHQSQGPVNASDNRPWTLETLTCIYARENRRHKLTFMALRSWSTSNSTGVMQRASRTVLKLPDVSLFSSFTKS